MVFIGFLADFSKKFRPSADFSLKMVPNIDFLNFFAILAKNAKKFSNKNAIKIGRLFLPRPPYPDFLA